MTTYEIAWGLDETEPTGQPVRQVQSAAELDAVLDEISATEQFMVTIYPVGGEPDGPSMQIGIGHPQRGFVLWLGSDPGYAVDLDNEPLGEDLTFDYGGEPTDYGPARTRVSSEQVRQAVREFVATGARPRFAAGKNE